MKFCIIFAILLLVVQSKKGSPGGKGKKNNEGEKDPKDLSCLELRKVADEWSAKAYEDEQTINTQDEFNDWCLITKPCKETSDKYGSEMQKC